MFPYPCCSCQRAEWESGLLFIHLMQRRHQINKCEAWLTKQPLRSDRCSPQLLRLSSRRVGWNLSEDRVHHHGTHTRTHTLSWRDLDLQRCSVMDGGTVSSEHDSKTEKWQINPAETDCFPLTFYWFPPAPSIKNKNETSWLSYRHLSVKEDV